MGFWQGEIIFKRKRIKVGKQITYSIHISPANMKVRVKIKFTHTKPRTDSWSALSSFKFHKEDYLKEFRKHACLWCKGSIFCLLIWNKGTSKQHVQWKPYSLIGITVKLIDSCYREFGMLSGNFSIIASLGSLFFLSLSQTCWKANLWKFAL